VPHPARIYDYFLGGKDNFQADRDAAAGIVAGWPNLAKSMRANRDFLRKYSRSQRDEQQNGFVAVSHAQLTNSNSLANMTG